MKLVKPSITPPDGARGQPSYPRVAGAAAKVLASGLGFGYVPLAQGTAGSLWGPILYYLFLAETGGSGTAMTWFAAATGVVIVTGVWASDVCERFWGHDPGRVVIDEVAGVMVAMLFIQPAPLSVWAAFLAFRVFDIFKPPPARQLERLPGGWGVMADDLVAGLFANIAVRILLRVV